MALAINCIEYYPVNQRFERRRAFLEKRKLTTIFEVTGSVLAMAYALLIASNTGNEVLGFALLFLSASLFAAWGFIDKRWAFLALQFFYAASAIIGLVRWG